MCDERKREALALIDELADLRAERERRRVQAEWSVGEPDQERLAELRALASAEWFRARREAAA
ncbi:MAG TPA: hypothetical protein VNT54_07305 [Solirubrobacteraceae bacterium]|nr:hypothetical protein [Solirubrobacteraceae bacterium]